MYFHVTQLFALTRKEGAAASFFSRIYEVWENYANFYPIIQAIDVDDYDETSEPNRSYHIFDVDSAACEMQLFQIVSWPQHIIASRWQLCALEEKPPRTERSRKTRVPRDKHECDCEQENREPLTTYCAVWRRPAHKFELNFANWCAWPRYMLASKRICTSLWFRKLPRKSVEKRLIVQRIYELQWAYV